MTTRQKLIPIILLFIGGLLFLLWCQSSPVNAPVVIDGPAAPPVPTLAPARVSQGAALYGQHCAGCHGANLEGAPNWQQPGPDGAYPPPPHDSAGHTWHHSDGVLLSIVENGGDPVYDSKMPAFREKLSSDEILAILEFLKSRWGRDEREYQWWITASGNPG